MGHIRYHVTTNINESTKSSKKTLTLVRERYTKNPEKQLYGRPHYLSWNI